MTEHIRRTRFPNREVAGAQLAVELQEKVQLASPFVLALPRGGVPVAIEVARQLRAPMDVFVVRKVGVPHSPELGMGAVAEGGTVVADDRVRRMLGISEEVFEHVAALEREEVERRVRRYRRGRDLIDFSGRDVVVVDDGLATGVTAEAALRALQERGVRRLVLAAPVCATETAHKLGQLADSVVCLLTPEKFRAVGLWYDRFDQLSDREVIEMLEAVVPSNGRPGGPARYGSPRGPGGHPAGPSGTSAN